MEHYWCIMFDIVDYHFRDQDLAIPVPDTRLIMKDPCLQCKYV